MPDSSLPGIFRPCGHAQEGPEGWRAWSPWPQKAVSHSSCEPALREPGLPRGDHLGSEPRPKALPHTPGSPPPPISRHAPSACSQLTPKFWERKREARASSHGQTLCNAGQWHRHTSNPAHSEGQCRPPPCLCSVFRAMRNGGSYRISNTTEPVPNLIFISTFH